MGGSSSFLVSFFLKAKKNHGTVSPPPAQTCPGLCPVSKDGESATTLGILLRCLATLTIKMCFLAFR